MDDLIKIFHIDWKLMIAQLVNFAIVAFVLWKFALKPLLKIMDERADKISDSLEQAKQIETELKSLDQKRVAADTEAKVQAQIIIKEAQVVAEAKRQELMVQVKEETARTLEQAREVLIAEQVKAMQAVRQQAARLVTQALTKILTKVPAGAIDKELIESAVQEAGKKKS